MEIVNEIINPSPVESLGPRNIMVEFHPTNPTIKELKNVFPFETIFNLKQRIALALGTTPLEQIFIAVEEPTKPDEFRPLEFTWLFNDGLLKDPIKAPKQPDPHLYQDGAKMAVSPSIEYGITLEDSNLLNKKIHVWTLESVLGGEKPSDDIFEGFIRLYFPELTIMPMSTKISEEELTTLTEFRSLMDERLNTINNQIIKQYEPTIQKRIDFPELRQIYVFKTVLFGPKGVNNYDSITLELLFRDLQPSETRPFIRFFSGSDRIKPITKIGKKDDKFLISDKALLDSLMSDRPKTDMGAVIVIKRPVDVSRDRKLLGLCWTLRIYEDGSAEFYIGTPRRGESVSVEILSKAQEVADGMLVGTDWYKKQFRLCDLSALYHFKTSESEKLTENELSARLSTFMPFFYKEPKFLGENPPALAVLRYKAVSNYVKTSDPIMNFLTMLTFNTQPNEPISPLVELMKEFGLTEDEADEAYNKWERIHSEHVISYKTDAKGDLRIKDMAIRDSKSCLPTTDEEPSDDDLTVAAYNEGISVRIYENGYKEYNVVIAGCYDNKNGTRNLRRILSLISALFLLETKEPSAEPEPEPEPEQEQAETGFDESLMLGMIGNENEEEETVEQIEEQAVPKLKTSKGVPILEPLGKEWILDRLKSRDKRLFGFEVTGDKRIEPYSRQCQQTNKTKRQPIVITRESYVKIRNMDMYKGKVRFIEAPITNKKFEIAFKIGNTAMNQRLSKLRKMKEEGEIVEKKVIKALVEREAQLGKNAKTSKKEITDLKTTIEWAEKVEMAEYEEYLLRRGYSIEDNISVTEKGTRAYKPKSKTEPGDFDKIIKNYEKEYFTMNNATKATSLTKLKDELVVRFNKLKDNIAELKKKHAAEINLPFWTVTITGSSERNLNYYICSQYWCIYDDIPLLDSDFEKTKECPVCGGKLIENEQKPKEGETVIYRKDAKYSGFLSSVYHPNQLALPCCFGTPIHIFLPEGAQNPRLEIRLESNNESEEQINVPKESHVLAKGSVPLRPFLADKDNKDYIPRQNIFGRINKEWIYIDKGKVAIPPPVVNKFIGQNPEDFLTKRGPDKQGILSYLLPYEKETTPARAFVRYSITDTTNIRNPGELFFSLISWARYVINEFTKTKTNVVFESNPQHFKQLLMKEIADPAQEQKFKNAFQQANYGTLVHEFSRREDNGVTDKAWERFKAYLADDKEQKELRLFESLLGVPGLFTETGFILVRFVLRIDKDPVIECPDFGISRKDRDPKLPFLFILQAEVSPGRYTYDPLILYNGKDVNMKELYGVLIKDTKFANIDKLLATYATEKGCGRYVNPINPWAPQNVEISVPSLSELNIIEGLITDNTKLLRDLSNRLAGIVVDKGVYIPCADDGLILKDLKSMNSTIYFNSKYPDLNTIIETYKQVKQKANDTIFNKIDPKKLLIEDNQYTGLELNCGIIIPIHPIKVNKQIETEYGLTSENKKWDRVFSEESLVKRDSDLRFYTKEEELEEGYQHLRITLADYLAKGDKGTLRKVIDDVQKAYQANEILYVLQKRLENALKPHVEKWVTLDERRNIKPYDLRRNCVNLKEAECVEGCTWKEGKCMIHTNKPDRFRNVDIISLMTARLADELIRTFGLADEILNNKISRIIPVKGIIDSDTALTFTEVDKSVKELLEKRQPTEYTAGLTYPEERIPF